MGVGGPTLILNALRSRTTNQPKEEVFGTDIPRTSGGHSRGSPRPKLRSGRSKSWKNKHFGADIHDPKARTSTTLRDSQKLRSEKLWAEFSVPKKKKLFFASRPSEKWGISSGKSKWGLSNGGLRPLSAICAQSSTIVHFCGPFGASFQGELSSQNDDNRRQSRTIP